MAIQYVGGVSSSRNGNSNATTTQSLTALTGGIASAPAAGDLVVVVCVVGSQGRNPAQAISGYSTLGTQLNPTAVTYDTSLQVSYKVMTSTPDTSITIPAQGNAADGQAWAVMVFRGIDQTTPFDPSSVSATGTATGRFNAPAITPSNAGSWIVIAGGGAAATGAAYVAPTGFTTNWLAPAAGADTNDAMAAMGYYTGWTSGSYDPAVVTGGTTGANDSWAAWTMALKPDPAQTITQSSRFDNSADLDNAHQVDLVLPQGTSFSNTNDFYAATISQPSPQTITQASLFTNTNTFYAPSVGLVLVQNGPYNWFGSSEWAPILSPDPDTFYSATISTTVALTAGLFTNTNSFYAADVSLGAAPAQDLTASLYTNDNSFFSATVAESGVQALTPSLYTNDPTFYSSTVTTTVTISQDTSFTNSATFYGPNLDLVLAQDTRLDNSPSFYAATVSTGGGSPQDLTPTLFTNTNSFYGPTVNLVLVQNGPYNWFGSSEWASILSPDPDTFYTHSISLGLTATRYDNTATFYGPTIDLSLTQGTRFDNAQTFHGPTVTTVTSLTQAARFDNSNGFYVPTLGLYLSPNLVTNTNGFYAPQVNLVLLATLASNTPEFFAPTIVVSGGEQSLIQVATPSNTQTFYGHEVFLEQLLVPLRHENTQTFYGPVLRNQYPDPSKVLVGTVYGEPGLEFTGTWVPDLDKSIKVDIVSGKLVKLINNKVALTF